MAVSIPQYAQRMANAVPGLLYGTTQWVVDTKKAGEDIAFGAPLFAVAADGHEVVAKDSTKALKLLGVAGFVQNVDGCYKDDRPVNCVREGYIYVQMAGTIAENEEVYVKYADGTFVSKTVADAGTSGDYVALNAHAVEAGANNAIVPIYIRG